LFLFASWRTCHSLYWRKTKKEILPGAYQTAQYLPLLKNKRVGLFTNHTATVGKKHLIDTLLASGIQIQKVFTPEHGLRGTADAGEKNQGWH